MFEMFGGKTVSRRPKNAAITLNNRRKSRGVSTKARSKLAPKKSTKRTRRGRKHGGRASTNNKPTENFPAMTENVVEKIKEENLENVEQVADIMKKEILKNKSAKEKADILNGIARHVRKNPRTYKVVGTIILLAIFIIAYQSNLIGFMTRKGNDLWDSIFSSVPSAVRKPARKVAEAAEAAKDFQKDAETAEKNAKQAGQEVAQINLQNPIGLFNGNKTADEAATEAEAAATKASDAATAAVSAKDAAVTAYGEVNTALTEASNAVSEAKMDKAAANVRRNKTVNYAAAKFVADEASMDKDAAAAAAAAAKTAAAAAKTAADAAANAAAAAAAAK